MNRRRFTISVGATLMVFMLATSYIAVAAEYGSKDDPLVTLSYLDDVMTPKTLESLNSVVKTETDNYVQSTDKKITNLKTELDSKIASMNTKLQSLAGDSAFAELVAQKLSGSTVNKWETVKIENGKTIKGNVGTRFIVRSGTATATSGLTNLSTGANLATGGSLVQNNLYIATADNSGLKATSSITVLVCGSYTIA